MENVWIAASRVPRTIELGRFVEDEGVSGHKEMYIEILEMYEESWKAGFEWMLKKGKGLVEGGMVVHCTGTFDPAPS